MTSLQPKSELVKSQGDALLRLQSAALLLRYRPSKFAGRPALHPYKVRKPVEIEPVYRGPAPLPSESEILFVIRTDLDTRREWSPRRRP